MKDKVVARFVPERSTKNTVRFNEVVGLGTPAIGVLYVQKSALKEIGYKEGDDLEVTISIAEVSSDE
jgi:hypothetical protein